MERSGLTTKEINDYWRDGFIVINDVLNQDELEDLRAACDQPNVVLKRPQKDYETKTVHSLGITSLHPAFYSLAMHPVIVEKIKSLLGPDIQLQHSKLATKPLAKEKGLFPFHQDFAFYPHTNTDLLSVMVMLDDATPENGCMQMVKGSHKLGLLSHEANGQFTAECQVKEYTEDSKKFINITPRAGGISIHHCLTIHGSPPNLSGRPRRGIVFSYRMDDAYQLADTIFEDTGLQICGSPKGVVRCEAETVRLPYRKGSPIPYGTAWNQIGEFAQDKADEKFD
jgi:phytanoyl-CoA hydroxylase